METCCICDCSIDKHTNKCTLCKVSKEDIEAPPNKYLTKIFSELNISSSLSFKFYMDKLLTEYNFNLINNFDNFDLYKFNDSGEHRIFSREIYFRNKIIDSELEFLHLVDSTKISFMNCIFKCDVNISEISQNMNKVHIDQCIFLKSINIYSIKDLNNLSIFHSNINKLTINDCKIKELFIGYCKISSLKVKLITTDNFYTNNNKIEDYIFSKNIIDDINFDYKQLNINWSLQNYLKHMNLPNIFYRKYNNNNNLFTFLSSPEAENEENIYLENIDFLRKYTSIQTNKEDYNNILLLESLLHQQKKSSKFLMWILGGFVKPFNFLIIATIVILFFSIVYLLPFINFNFGSGASPRHLNFLEALYFSGITFTTIGYGDISPIGIIRVFVVIEGFLGVLISSSLLTSLIRKYIN